MKPSSSGPDDVRARLRDQPAPVRYDVQRGLARHRHLIATQAPLPDWANELPPPRRPGWLRRAGYIAGLLSVGAVLWLRGAAEPGAAGAPASEQATPLPASPTNEITSTPAPTVNTRAPARPSEARAPSEAVEPPAASSVQPLVEAPVAVSDTAEQLPAASERARPRTRAREGALLTANKREHGPRSARVAAPQDNLELRQLVEAERALPSDPLRALRLAREGELNFRSGYFAQERRYIEVMALFALGRLGEAHAQAAAFLRDYPSAPYRRKVELALLRQPQH